MKQKPTLRESEKKHSSEYLWQILVPILASVLVTLVVGLLVIITTVNGLGIDVKWAHISVIFLIFPFLFIGIILFALLVFTSRLVRRFHNFLPPQFARLNMIISSVEGFTQASTKKVTQPLIDLNSFTAGVIRLLELAFHRNQTQRRKND